MLNDSYAGCVCRIPQEIGGRLRSGALHPIHHADGASAGSVLDREAPPVTVDLGASWVHGVNDNPVSALATAAGVTLVNTTANTIIRDVDGSPVPPDRDELYVVPVFPTACCRLRA